MAWRWVVRTDEGRLLPVPSVALLLVRIGSRGILPWLVEQWGHGDPDLLLVTLLAMGRSGDRSHASAVRPRLEDPDPAIRRMALWALGQLKDHDLDVIAMNVLRDGRDEDGLASWILASRDVAAAAPVILDSLRRDLLSRSGPATFRAGLAALALGRLRPPGIVAELKRMSAHAPVPVKGCLAKAIQMAEGSASVSRMAFGFLPGEELGVAMNRGDHLEIQTVGVMPRRGVPAGEAVPASAILGDNILLELQGFRSDQLEARAPWYIHAPFPGTLTVGPLIHREESWELRGVDLMRRGKGFALCIVPGR